jgi:drug/metabolite transporter superfamily protein YnfA
MAQQATATGGIEHWLKEEMAMWHVLPLFLVLAVVGMLAGSVVPGYTGTHLIGAAALFCGYAMGWTARRQASAS